MRNRAKTAALLALPWAVALAVPVRAPAEPCGPIDPAPLVRTDPAFARARAAFAAGRIDEAIGQVDAWRDANPSIPRGIADWQAGRWLQEAGRPADALERLAAVSGSPLDDDARLREGRLHLDAGDLARARAAFAGISPASRHWAPARLALADALVREGRAGAAGVVVADLLRDELSAVQRTDAVRAAIRIRALSGRVPDAIALARSAWLKAPTASLPDLSRERERLGAPPTPLDARLRTLLRGDPREWPTLVRRARTHRKAADAPDPGLADLVRGMVLQADPGNRDRALALLEGAASTASDRTLAAIATYEAGDVLVNGGDDREARIRYRRALERDPDGPVAAEAAISAARCSSRLGDAPEAVAILDRLAAADPPQVPEVRLRWEIALAWMLAGRSAEALDALDRALPRLERGTGLAYGAAERARYFRGRMLEAAGRDEEALADLRRVARNDPHTWFGMLARQRLAQRGMASGASPPADPTCTAASGPAWLWRLGYRDEARAEMAARSVAGVLDEASARILADLLADPSVGEGRQRARDFLRGVPDPAEEATVDAAYPRPFAEHVAAAVGESGIDPALVYGVIRVESAFRPNARSPKGAIGLMQLLPAAARRVASVALGDRKAARGLWRPANNIRLGTAYLAELSRHFHGHLPLVLAGYHAGPGAARRFLRSLGRLPTDLFVEAMPYAATSAYVKRVLSFAAGYRALLDDGTRGPMSVDPVLPSGLGPFMEPRRPEPKAAIPAACPGVAVR